MLTNAAIKAARPRQTAYKLPDGDGLALLVKPTGARCWRFRYTWHGREKMLSLGLYPAVGLALARSKRDEMRRLLAAGVDPSAERKAQRAAHKVRFDDYLTPWIERHEKTLRQSTRERNALIYAAVRKELGSAAVATLTGPDIARAIQAIEAAHGRDYAERAHGVIAHVLDSAGVDGKLASNPARFKTRAVLGARAKSRKYPGLTDPARFGELLRAIDAYQGSPVTRAALQLQARLFVRPNRELLRARWREFDFEAALWTIPAERMKMGRRHLVPLPWQVGAIMHDLAPLTDRGPDSFVFGSLISGRHLSENTLNAALRRMDFDTRTEHCAHGFRTSASTMLRERVRFQPAAAIELQLAHAKPGVQGIYDESELLSERQLMLQQWSDYLDALAASA